MLRGRKPQTFIGRVLLRCLEMLELMIWFILGIILFSWPIWLIFVPGISEAVRWWWVFWMVPAWIFTCAIIMELMEEYLC